MILTEYDAGYDAGRQSAKGDCNPYRPFTKAAQGWNAGARAARARRKQLAIYANAKRLYDALAVLVEDMSEVGEFYCVHDAKELLDEIDKEG